MCRLLALFALTTVLVSASVADDGKGPEQLPPPRQLPAEAAVLPLELPLNTMFMRDNRWDVWQFYGVDRSGYFRPRVVYSPYGSYYVFNGRPYPFDQLFPREWLMTQVGTPNRMPPPYMPLLED
jgi:hypothetical protein